jgi:hypothetical protein
LAELGRLGFSVIIFVVQELIDFVVSVCEFMDGIRLIPDDLRVHFRLTLLHFLHRLDVSPEEIILFTVTNLARIRHLGVELGILLVLVIEEFHKRLLDFLVLAKIPELNLKITALSRPVARGHVHPEKHP